MKVFPTINYWFTRRQLRMLRCVAVVIVIHIVLHPFDAMIVLNLPIEIPNA